MPADATTCTEALERIAAVHEGIGYPREVVAQWALPTRDALDLWEIALASGARRVLEVGSFVGTSALLLAHALPEAEIHSVDPNLPLEIEFSAIGTFGKSADLSRRTLEIARIATDRLGLAARVHFHEGGFAVGESFALADAAVPVIGPALCAREGPFDLAFVDGLHFEDAVHADVTLALSALAPNGTIVLHDAVGYWGSHVRRAVARILEAQPELVFRHHPYRSLYRAIGTLGRVAPAAVPLEARVASAFGDQRRLVDQFARIVRLHFPQEPVVGCDPLSAEVVARLGASAGGSTGQVVVALDTVDAVPPHEVPQVLGKLLAGCDAGLIGLTPPGESGAASAWSRPLSARVREFDALGFDAFDLVQPMFEPHSYAFGDRCAIPWRTSFLLESVIVARRGSTAWERLRAHAPLTVERARSLTDLRLQLLFATCSHFDLREQHEALRQQCASLEQQRDSYQQQRESLQQQRESLQQQRESLQQQRESLQQPRESLQQPHQELLARHAALEVEARRLSELVRFWSSWRIHVGRHHFWRRPEVAPASERGESTGRG
jgi:predicted O-methyltransferase YrrM